MIPLGHYLIVSAVLFAIGTAGVQLAKHLGYHVTAVTSTKNVDLVRALGAESVIDYTRDDFTKNGRAYDVIFNVFAPRCSYEVAQSRLEVPRLTEVEPGHRVACFNPVPEDAWRREAALV